MMRKDDNDDKYKLMMCCDEENDDVVTEYDGPTNLENLLKPQFFRKFKYYSLLLGFMVGLFIQFSTLGANFLLLTLFDNQNDDTAIDKDQEQKQETIYMALSLMWSAITSIMAIITLQFLKNLFSISFQSTMIISADDDVDGEKNIDNDDEDDDDNTIIANDEEDILEEIILHLEFRFIVGALIGVCFAWIVTDIVLGLKYQIMYSIIILLGALIWCKLLMYWFTKSKKDDEDINNKKKKNDDQDNNLTTPLLIV